MESGGEGPFRGGRGGGKGRGGEEEGEREDKARKKEGEERRVGQIEHL